MPQKASAYCFPARSAIAMFAASSALAGAFACQTYTPDLLLSAAVTGGGGVDEPGGGVAGSVVDGGGRSGGAGGAPLGGTGASSGAPVIDPPGTAGESGAGGEPGGDGNGKLELIDNAEDRDAFVLAANGRNGSWAVSNDGTSGANQSPAPGQQFSMSPVDAFPLPGSTYAAHTEGQGFKTWGAILNVNWRFAPEFNAIPTYDAAAYTGISFIARSSKSQSTRVSVRWVSADTDPRGGECDPQGDAQTACYNHFAVELPVTEQWSRHSLRFDTFRQIASGKRFDAINLVRSYGVEFFFLPGGEFDLWIDDLAFMLD